MSESRKASHSASVPIRIRPLVKSDRDMVSKFMDNHWGSRSIVIRGRMVYPEKLEGFVAMLDGEVLGLATFRIDGGACELVTLNSLREGVGVGGSLMDSVKAAAKDAKCKRLWLITTNDNMHALHFYQRRGFHITAVYPNALEESRRLKPEIPLVGDYGIPLRDEIELEMRLP
jgi:ribosomal protein S18 acetylase RimI-like enzyme